MNRVDSTTRIIVFTYLLFAYQVFGQSDNSPDTRINDVLINTRYEPKSDDWLKSEPSTVLLNKKLVSKGYQLEDLQTIWQNDYRSSPDSKYFDIHLELWEFSDKLFASSACDTLKHLTETSSFFEKPPKTILQYGKFFLVISTPSANNRPSLKSFTVRLENKLKANSDN